MKSRRYHLSPIFIAALLLITLTCKKKSGGSTAPEITSISPTEGPVGTNVTINGSGFSPTASQNTVTFDGAAATVSSASESELQTTVPEGATTGAVSVTVEGETASGPAFTVEELMPGIASIEPDSGVVGTEVTITGMNFSSVAAENTITFNGTEAPIRGAAQDQLITQVPESATDGPVEVAVNGKSTTGPDFNVITEGTLEVTIATSGPDQDEDGYHLIMDGTTEVNTDTIDTVYIDDLEEGIHVAELTDIAQNCTVESDNPRSVTITAGDTTSIAIDISCTKVLKNQIVFSSTRDANVELYVMNTDGTQQIRLTNTSGSNETFGAISPDGTQVTFSNTNGGTGDIAVINADGTGRMQITFTGQEAGYPRWSPDGDKIVFISNRDGNLEVYSMNGDGTAQTRLTNDSGDDLYAEWSPDGTKIYFTSDRDGDSELFEMNADGTGITQITADTVNNFVPVPSPDGSKIAFISDRDGDNNLFVMNSDGSNVQQLTADSGFTRFPSWSPDGSRIVFDTDIDGNTEIYSIGVDGSNLTNLTNHADSDGLPFWSPVE